MRKLTSSTTVSSGLNLLFVDLNQSFGGLAKVQMASADLQKVVESIPEMLFVQKVETRTKYTIGLSRRLL